MIGRSDVVSVDEVFFGTLRRQSCFGFVVLMFDVPIVGTAHTVCTLVFEAIHSGVHLPDIKTINRFVIERQE